jgi:uncharacterized protein
LPASSQPKGSGGFPPREVVHQTGGRADFDGRFVKGELLNAPNWLKSVSAGDAVRVPLAEISDWMYAFNGDDYGGEVYGAYTVNLMRSRMSQRERQEHDDAWGLNFGDPHNVRIVPKWKKSGGLLKALFGRRGDAGIQEHPMSEAMASALKDRLAEDPSMLHAKGGRGWTLLHNQALAGSAATVKILLEAGADPNATADDGTTPLQLARSLGWDKVIALLVSKGAR